MRISIFGLGYVGAVTSAILSKEHKVIGVDVSAEKISMINDGKSPIIEKDVDVLIKEGVEKKNLEATDDHTYAVKNTDVSIVCVGTPSNDDGSHNMKYIDIVMGQIAEAVKSKGEYHLVVLRSTVPPGTTEEMKEKYFKDIDAGICFNPEFLREGAAVADYMDPPFIVVGCSDEKAVQWMKALYKDIDAEFVEVKFKEAEILKVFCNVFHALKIVFANEVGRFCSGYGLDGKRVMELLCMDKKLNISEKYLRPGFAYGGSCLPKDLRSLLHLAKQRNIAMPVIEKISLSNEGHIGDAIKRIESFGTKKLGFVGLSFKPGTDDLRESPYVNLVEYFIGKGYDIKIFDKDVSLAKLFGANKAYIEKEIPHISSLLVNDVSELSSSDVIVLNRELEKDFSDKQIIDLK